MSKFQVYKDARGKYRFRLRAGNNQIVAVGEAYEQHASCINGIRSIQRNRNSEIEDLTIKGPRVANPKYQIYKDKVGEYRFRLKAPNGEIIAESEGYESKDGCLNGIEVVRGSGEAEIVDSSITKRASQEKIIDKAKETASSSKAGFENLSSTENINVEAKTQEIEASASPTDAQVKTETETVLPQAEKEMPQKILSPIETEMPPNIGEGEIVESSVAKKTILEKVPDRIEEITSASEKNLEVLSGTQKESKVEVNPPEIEVPTFPLNTETKVQTKAVLPEVEREELPQDKSLLPLETEIPQGFPVETKLELYTVPQNINKGNHVTLQGKLSSNSGKGVPGAKIKIYERDKSILGDDYLAHGVTGEDGTFNIVWKARPLSWRKDNGDIYAKFAGNEIAKPSKSGTQTISVK